MMIFIQSDVGSQIQTQRFPLYKKVSQKNAHLSSIIKKKVFF